MFKRHFCIRNLNLTQVRQGNQPQYSQGVIICKGRDLVPSGGIHTQGWTAWLLSQRPEVSLPVTCIRWCCCVVENPTSLCLPMCMTDAPAPEGRVLVQKAFPTAALRVPALKSMMDPGAAWTQPCLCQRLPSPRARQGTGLGCRGCLWCCPWSLTTIPWELGHARRCPQSLNHNSKGLAHARCCPWSLTTMRGIVASFKHGTQVS